MKILNSKIANCFLLLGFLVFLFACKKEAPSPLGEYRGYFFGTYMWGDSVIRVDEINKEFQLTEITDTALIFNNNYYQYIERNGDSLYGPLLSSGSWTNSYYTAVEIMAKWNISPVYYYINGTYTVVTTNDQHIDGAFQLIKN